jgi:FtsZ-binding cell division protein ZapB
MTIDWYALIAGVGSGAITAILTLLFSRRKTTAEIGKLVQETEILRLEGLDKMQTQIDKLRERNDKLYQERETENNAKEKLRTELDRVHEVQELQQREFVVVREEKLLLIKQVNTLNAILLERDIRITGLEAVVGQHEITIKEFESKMRNVTSKTGQLLDQFKDDYKDK